MLLSRRKQIPGSTPICEFDVCDYQINSEAPSTSPLSLLTQDLEMSTVSQLFSQKSFTRTTRGTQDEASLTVQEDLDYPSCG